MTKASEILFECHKTDTVLKLIIFWYSIKAYGSSYNTINIYKSTYINM